MVMLVTISPANPSAELSEGARNSGKSGSITSTKAAPSAFNVAQKKRCQTLISHPVQFIRGIDGVVIPEKNLITNNKGTDFSIVSWVYISNNNKSSLSKTNFLFGKLQHNDMWPIVVLRGADLKLEVLYGKNVDGERFTSQASIPLSTWVHVVVTNEGKKIKLYINGSMDSQVATAGNQKAVNMPLLIGSCPHNVKTRVEHVREGFDGQLASFKYYTRSLSLVHVRVIFDQGAPEMTDCREKWMLQLLASGEQLNSTLKAFNHVNCRNSAVNSTVSPIPVGCISQDTVLCYSKVLLSLVISDNVNIHATSNTSSSCVLLPLMYVITSFV